MIARNNKLKILTKHVSCNSKFKFDGSNCNLNQKLKKNKCRCECKYFRKNMYEKGYIWDPDKCSCENSRDGKSIIDDSVIMCDEIMETTKCFMAKIVTA